MKKTTQLKNLLLSSDTEYIMEAHDGISAKIVEETGIKGIWASSLCISATLGVRDCNEASWTQVLDMVEAMNENCSIPILLDGDTGYGNFNNVRRLVKKMGKRDIAGVCIEDKLFPKTNSFIGGEKQPLADIDEFCGKIRAAKDSQMDPDFVVVARIEALITGWGLGEALKRAQAYCNAGADAILVHSKSSTIDQIKNFMEKCNCRSPIIVVPTTYYQTRPGVFNDLDISVVVWGNHMLRSAITAMQENAKKIYMDKSLINTEEQIIPTKEIFRLQNVEELREAERVYLPQKEEAKGIILAASRGPEFEELTLDKPKAMIELDGKPVLKQIQHTFNNCEIKDITAVLGYKHETVNIENLQAVIHPEWEKASNAYTLYKVIDKLTGPVAISYGDILFAEKLLKNLMDAPEDIVLAVDTSWANSPIERSHIFHVVGAEPFSEKFGSATCTRLLKIGCDISPEESTGEWIGLIKLSSNGSEVFRKYLKDLFSNGKTTYMRYSMQRFLQHLIGEGVDIYVSYFHGHWLDLDSKKDLERYYAWRKDIS